MNISDFDKCSNCGACYNICPKDAISVKEEGLFYTPVINSELCVNCEVCVKVCPVNNEMEGVSPIDAFAGWHKDNAVVMSSSSGGVFYGIAQSILECNGVVYSASYSNDGKQVIFMSSDQVELSKLQKSKYVESIISDSYRSIKKELEKNRYVLFCGTPCQVAGLKRFLRKKYKNLITCDFACGGFPSHKLYTEYLDVLERKYKSKVKKVDFRPKTHGWKRYAILVEFENGKKYNVLGTEDPYLRSFLYGKYTVRDYCLDCKFSNTHLSDITIADFWLHKKLTNLNNENGISLVLCNTEQGRNVLDNLNDKYVLERLDLQTAMYNYEETQTSEIQKEKHSKFLRESMENSFISAYKMFFKDSWKIKIKNRIARIVFKNRGI